MQRSSKFTVDEIENGSLPASMRLKEFCDGVGLNPRYGQRLAQEGKLPCVMFENRWYVNVAEALKLFGLNAGAGE